MEKKLKTFIVFLCVGISAIHAHDFSAVAPSGQTLYYKINSGTTTVKVVIPGSFPYWIGYSKPTGDLIIPSVVTHGGTTYSVTSIGQIAFESCKDLSSVSIPNTVTSIEDYAFSACNGLRSVDLGDSLSTIGGSAFAWCNNLRSVSIPNSVNSIGVYAFDNCSSMTSISISNSITSIEEGTFRECRNLISITIPNSVTSIGALAFKDCSGMTSVSLGDSITSIGSEAFYGCYSLNSVTIPNTVTTIEGLAFSNCTGLSSINIPNSVTSIGQEAFSYCTNLVSVYIPSSVTEMGDGAFGGVRMIYYHGTASGAQWGASCMNGYIEDSLYYTDSTMTVLTGAHPQIVIANIPSSVTHIQGFAFVYCKNLTTVDIPASVVELGYGTFYGCSRLPTVSLPNSITSIEGETFSGCSSLVSVTIPNSVTSIGDWTFSDCSSLTSVAIPNLVDTIYDYAFNGCNRLAQISIQNDNPPYIYISAFEGVPSTCIISVPCNSASIYHASDWGNLFSNIIESSCCNISINELPYTDNFDTYTTFTTAKTGVEPDCWTLVHQDVAMTDEYKPMIYYKSANAHSGNYSLILNKRGIYAMPEYDGDINTLRLSFYLKQQYAKYQLQVGVLSDPNNPETFTPVATLNNSTSGVEHVTVNFASYTGTGRHIAFRNILAPGYTGDFSCNYIDDLTLELRPDNCAAIQVTDLPYTDNFDTYTTSTTAKTGVEPDCWTLVHQDVAMADEYKPMIYYKSANAHSGNYSLILNKRGIYAMPEYDGDINTLRLSFYLKQQYAKYQLQVGVLSDPNNPETFTPVATLNNSTTGVEHVTVNFASYTGDGHHIAFRNILAPGYAGDFSCNYIDDLTLELRPDNCAAIQVTDLPYTNNFDTYTTSTTAKTGVEPDCWILVHQDVAMTDEYKPMIYYKSANAHSGNYSLILNKRGIYAMPEYDGDVNTLRLSFYLKQQYAKYQLQVGVLSDPNNPETFTPVATLNNSTTGVEHVTVNFASYTGDGHHIAFRNILAPGYSGNFSCNYIDDINLSVAAASVAKGSGDEEVYSDGGHRLSLYPNPTTGKLTVEADDEVARVDVFDYTSRCVATYQGQTILDLGHLAAGLYTLRLTLPDRIEVRRVVKQ